MIGTCDRTSAGSQSDGTIWTWGDNSQLEDGGSLGAGGGCPVSIYACPSQVPLTFDPTAKVTAVMAEHMTEFALMSDGTVWSWGMDSTGQLGYNPCCTSKSPGQVSLPVRATAIVGNQDDTVYALGVDGNVYAWGGNWQGNLGNGTCCAASYVDRWVAAYRSGGLDALKPETRSDTDTVRRHQELFQEAAALRSEQPARRHSSSRRSAAS